MKFYVLEVYKAAKGPQVVVSRTHKNVIRRLFELEVPEIFKGIVEIKAIAREGGYRSKVAVWSNQENVDPVGACVGLRGTRIQNVVNELNGERIDVVLWDPESGRFVAHALSPAQVVNVRVNAETNTAEVVVPDRQLSLAIGKEGQNARLAAKLTGWRIDIKSQSAYDEYLETLSPEERAALEAPPPKPEPVPEPVAVAPPGAEPPAPVEREPATPQVEEPQRVAVAAEATAAAGPAAPGIRFAEEILTPGREADAKRSKNKRGGPDEDSDKPRRGGGKRQHRGYEDVEDDFDYEFGIDPHDDELD